MTRLPVIIGFGGLSPAGRSSAHHGYRRLILDRLSESQASQTRASLASLMGLLQLKDGRWVNERGEAVEHDAYLQSIAATLEQGTLIRKLEGGSFDPENLPWHKRALLHPENRQPLSFLIRRQQLPEKTPLDWQVSDAGDGMLRVDVQEGMSVLLESRRRLPVTTAGQLPTGFDPRALYPSRNHPRGLQLTVVGASDALQSLGLDWEALLERVPADQVSVYAGSSMSQLDYEGNGGMLQARLLGRKVTSKQLPLGFAEMPADFINAYLLGNLGTTGANAAACATFLYNLRQGLRDIRSGSHRLAIVGTAEAPIVPEVIDGYASMRALAEDDALAALDGAAAPDHRRACRPFGHNAGFTLAESAQFIVLCDDELALELGANIYGSVNDVFINADGYKKSISSPGVGNYITMAKAAAATANIIGEQGLQQRSYVQAHGTGTPQNRVTESRILSRIAEAWGIENWPVTALKAHVGHSLGSASGDQLVASLGLWDYGWIPGITTTEAVAEDVYTEHLDILLDHREVGREAMDAVLINAKGFGGNNATASILAPHVTLKMLERRHGKAAMTSYRERNEAVREQAAAYDEATRSGRAEVIYRFNHNVLDNDAIALDRQRLRIQGINREIDLNLDNPYTDYL